MWGTKAPRDVNSVPGGRPSRRHHEAHMFRNLVSVSFFAVLAGAAACSSASLDATVTQDAGDDVATAANQAVNIPDPSAGAPAPTTTSGAVPATPDPAFRHPVTGAQAPARPR